MVLKTSALKGLVLFSLFTVFAPVTLAQPFAPGPIREAFPVPSDADVITTLGKSTKTQLPPKKLKFLVWNLYKGEKDSFKHEYLSLAFNRDVVIKQEVVLDKNMTSVFSYFPFFETTNATSFFTGKEKNIRTGVSTTSAVTPDQVTFVRTATLEPVVSSPKVSLITRYPIRFSTKLLTVINIHGINFVSNKNYRHEIDRIYQAVKNFPPPMVFAGDFNTWNEERLDILAEYSKKLGMIPAQFYPDYRMTFNGNPLDHFLHTKDLKVTSAKADGFYQGSDHKPLEVEIEIL